MEERKCLGGRKREEKGLRGRKEEEKNQGGKKRREEFGILGREGGAEGRRGSKGL
jgi:hypothetical protein